MILCIIVNMGVGRKERETPPHTQFYDQPEPSSRCMYVIGVLNVMRRILTLVIYENILYMY